MTVINAAIEKPKDLDSAEERRAYKRVLAGDENSNSPSSAEAESSDGGSADNLGALDAGNSYEMRSVSGGDLERMAIGVFRKPFLLSSNQRGALIYIYNHVLEMPEYARLPVQLLPVLFDGLANMQGVFDARVAVSYTM